MRNTKLLISSLLAIVITLYLPVSSGEGNKREWQTTACQNFALTVRDKASNAAYVAKYVVTASDGTIFVAEKKATDEDSARVVFPDNFYEERRRQKAWVNCSYAEKYKWEIYTNNVLIESGTTALTRNKPK